MICFSYVYQLNNNELHINTDTTIFFSLQSESFPDFAYGQQSKKWTSNVSSEDKICKRILLAKGSIIFPRHIQQGFRGSCKATDVVAAMSKLNMENLGRLVKPHTPRSKFLFHKKPWEEIKDNPNVSKYFLNAWHYGTRFYDGKEHNQALPVLELGQL